METEMPSICKEFDSLSEQISSIEAEISTLKERITEKTERIKEYLQILNLTTSCEVVTCSLEYYEIKIKEFHEELLSEDKIIKDSAKKLVEMRKELKELSIEVQKTDYVKINYINANPTSGVWISKERYKNQRIPCFRIV